MTPAAHPVDIDFDFTVRTADDARRARTRRRVLAGGALALAVGAGTLIPVHGPFDSSTGRATHSHRAVFDTHWMPRNAK